MTPTFIEDFKHTLVAAPATDAAGRTSTYVSMKNMNGKAYIVCNITQGNAATIALTPVQATAVAGTGSKGLTNNVAIWVNQDTAAGDTFTRQTDAKTFTTSAAVKNKTVIFEIPASALDINNDFDCIGLTTGASNAANITSVSVIGTQKYPGTASPTVLTD